MSEPEGAVPFDTSDEKILNEMLDNFDTLSEDLRRQIVEYASIARDELAARINAKISRPGSFELIESRDKLSLFITIEAAIAAGAQVSLRDVVVELKARGYKLRLKKKALLGYIAAVATATDIDSKVLIGVGTRPEDGKNGRLKMAVKAPLAVDKGVVVASYMPPTSGRDGHDIFGTAIPASPGEERLPQFDEEVLQFNATDSTIVTLISGVFEVRSSKLLLSPSLNIDGDFSGQDEKIEFNGTVRIGGSVLPGADITAAGDITIDGKVEGGRVVSTAGSVIVKGGVIGSKDQFISAAQQVVVKFVEGGVVFSQGDIEVKDAIVNSSVSAGGSIDCSTKRGTIAGGVVRFGGNLKVKVLGASGEPQTALYAGIDIAALEEMARVEGKIIKYSYESDDSEQKLTSLVGSSEDLSKFAEEVREQVAELKKKMLLSKYVLQNLVKERQELESESLKNPDTKIEVLGTIYRKVSVAVGRERYDFDREFSYAKISYDADKRTIIVG